MFGADKPRTPFAGFQLRCPSCQKREVPLDGSTVDDTRDRFHEKQFFHREGGR